MNSSQDKGLSQGPDHPLVVVNSSSLYLQQCRKAWSKVWSSYPLVFAAIADEKYIAQVEIFVESITAMGFGTSDIFIGCGTKLCTRLLTEKHIETRTYSPKKGCLTCLVGLAKAAMILDLLQSQRIAFFYDLDIFFKSNPLIQINPGAEYEIIAQNDRYDKLPYNFGCFLVRPTNRTIAMFVDVYNTLAINQTWDQEIFNRMIVKHAINATFFQDVETIALFHPTYQQFNFSRMCAIHMICTERPHNRILIAKSLFGSFLIPSLYMRTPARKTVAFSFQASNNISSHSPAALEFRERVNAMAKGKRNRYNLTLAGDYSHFQLENLIHMAIYVSRQLGGRMLRLVGWDYSRLTSLYNADQLASDNITMVEESFWSDGVKRFDVGYLPTTTNLTVETFDDLRKILSNESLLTFLNEVDEVRLVVPPTLLSQHPIDYHHPQHQIIEKRSNSTYICKFYIRSYHHPSFYPCLESCDPDPFKSTRTLNSD